MAGLAIIAGLIVPVAWTIAGLILFYSSEIYEAIREIAMNTRKDSAGAAASKPNQHSYNGLLKLATLARVFGVIILVLAGGVFLIGLSAVSGQSYF
jgi:hypothetical protein